jgi:peptide/nickel transport system substrate-binding protein
MLRWRRSWRLAAGLATSLVLLLSACGPGAPPTAAPTSAPAPPQATSAPTTGAKPAAAAPTAAKPAAGGSTSIDAPLEPMEKPSGPVKDTIVISMGQMPDTLHPSIGSMQARSEVLQAVFTEPVRNDDRGQWVAIGLEQVPTIDNGGARFVGDGDDKHLEVTYKIRQGVKWQDGTPTTARDIVYTWKLGMDPNFPATDRARVSKVYSVEALDDRTAVAKYMSPKQAREAAVNGFMGIEAKQWADYKDQQEPLTDPLYFYIPSGDANGLWLPEHILSQIPPDQQKAADWSNKPVGNGAYRVVDVVPQQTIRLEAVDDYFLGKPPTKTIVFRIIPDTNAQLAAAQAGELDVIGAIQGPDIDNSPELDALPGYKAYYVPGSPWEHIDLNLTNPVLADHNVRQALFQSINRQQIVDRILYGKTRVASSWIQPGVPPWAYDESCPTQYPYDPPGAGRLLEQSGYAKGGDGIYAKGGQPLRLRLQTTDSSLRKNVAQVIQANLKQAGVDLELEFMPATPFFAREGPLIQGTFELGMYTWLAAPDPDSKTLYRSSSAPSQDNNFVGQNYPRIKNPRLDQLLTQGANELSADKRKPMYCEAVKTWSQDIPVIPLFQRPNVSATRANMVNYRPTPTSTPETWNAWAWFIPSQ